MGKSTKLNLGWAEFAKNGLANVARGSSAAVMALVLTPFLTRHMPAESYGTWALILQLGAYVGYLDFGIQTAIGRFVALHTEIEDRRLGNEIASTSISLLLGAMAVSLLTILVLVWVWPILFQQMRQSMYHDARLAFLFVGGSLALGLPFGAFNGIFVGLQRNEIPALIFSANKFITSAVLVLLVLNGRTIVSMGCALFAVNLLSYFAQYVIYRRVAPEISINVSSISRRAGKELLCYCFSLSIWSFATVLVTGLDTTIVAAVDFKSLAYYAVPVTLVTFILGLQNAIFSALIPISAVLEARSNNAELGRLLVSTTRYGVLMLLGSGIPLILWGRPLLSIWVGTDYGIHSELILRVLVLANIIRLSAVPYAMLLIGTGQQRLVTLSPLIEGISNLLVSIVAGYLFGAIGVAIGTLVGSSVGILCNLFYNMPRTNAIAVDRSAYVKEGLLRPTICALPIIGLSCITFLVPELNQLVGVILLLVACTIMAFSFWNFGLLSNERARILQFLSQSSQPSGTA